MNKGLFTLEAVVDASGGRFVGPTLGRQIAGVSIDTRSLKAGELFIALPGENTDGHDFLAAAFSAGAAGALVKRSLWESLSIELRGAGSFVLVDDPLVGLQKLARWYLSHFSALIKIAVTGSNGKTTTKDLLASVLSTEKATYSTRGNYNSEIGLPLSVFGIRDEHVFAVFEMGSNRIGEIALLAEIVRPHIALITNIGTAHIGMFGSREAIADEKGAVFSSFDSSCRGLVWEDEPFAQRLLKDRRGSFQFFGPRSTDGITRLESKGVAGGSIRYRDREIVLKFSGRHNLLNACAVISAAQLCGISDDGIVRGLERVEPSFGRGEFVLGRVSVFQDCYNANIESLEAGLQVLAEGSWCSGRRIGVLGAMKELGEETVALHQLAGALCAASKLDCWYFFGAESKDAYEVYLKECDGRGFYFENFDDLERALAEYVRPGDLVYLKGSRSTGLERLTGELVGATGGRVDA